LLGKRIAPRVAESITGLSKEGALTITDHSTTSCARRSKPTMCCVLPEASKTQQERPRDSYITTKQQQLL